MDNQKTWMNFDYVRPYLSEYIAFLKNVNDGFYADWSVERIDERRKKFHDKVLKAFAQGREPSWREREIVVIDDIERLAKDHDGDIGKMTYSAYLKLMYKISKETYKGSGIKTMFASREAIEKSIEREHAEYDEFFAECEAINNAWKRDKEIFDSHFEKYDDMCHVSFDHDYNGAQYSIKCAFKILDQWKNVPMEAMLEPSVQEYYYGPLETIKRCKEKMAYIMMRCKMFHRKFLEGKTKWDVSGIDFGKEKKDE